MELKEKTQGFSLKNKTAVIIGCGGLGCNIAVHLAGSGIGKLILCDFDTVSEGNLNRQFLYSDKDIGKSKVLCAKEKLNIFSSDCIIEAINKKIEKTDDLEPYKNCDIIFAATDNDSSRMILTEFADNHNLPLVIGGIDGFYGMAYLYLPKSSSPPPISSSCAAAEKSVSPTAGIIGSAQAALGIKYLLTEDKKIAKNILIYDETEFNTLKLK